MPRFGQHLRTWFISLIAALMLAGGGAAEAHESVQGQVGPHGRASVRCDTNGLVTTTLNYWKIGLGPQQAGANIQYYDIDRRYWRETGWKTYQFGYGQKATYENWMVRLPAGRYYVYTLYGWNLGSGWAVDGAWAGSYTTVSGDAGGYAESFCRTVPMTTVVSGCGDFGSAISTLACSSAAPARAPRAGTRVRVIERTPTRKRPKRARRKAQHALPAPPPHVPPSQLP